MTADNSAQTDCSDPQSFEAYTAGGYDPGDFEDAYQGRHNSEQDFAQQLADDLDLVSADYSWPASYIDWERATHDLFLGDYWSTDAPGGGVYVFRTV